MKTLVIPPSHVTNIRRPFFLAGLVSALFLSIGGAHAQVMEPRSYLFVEVREVTGRAIGDATITVSNAAGKQLLNERTYQEGTLNTSFHQQYDHHYDLQITKPGYLPFEQVIFPIYPHATLVALSEDLPGAGEPVDYAHGPPIKIALLKTPVTSAERRDVADEDQKRQLLLAVKRDDAASVSNLLQAGAKANTADNKGVPAIAWAAFAGDPATIKLLLGAGAIVRNKNSLAHEALLIYLADGMGRCRDARRGKEVWPRKNCRHFKQTLYTACLRPALTLTQTTLTEARP